MSDSFADAAAKIDKIQKGLNGQALRQITTKVAGRYKGAIVPKVQPSGLSHYGRGGKRGSYVVKARYTIKSDSQALVTPTPPGLSALLEKGSGTTWKAPKRKGSKRRKKGSITSYQRAAVRPRHAWSKATDQVNPQVPPWIAAEVHKLLKDVIG